METFRINQPVHPDEEGVCEIDISVWLGSDTIKSVAYTAKTNKGIDATSIVLDANKSTYSGHTLKPYIMGGIDRTSYKVLALVKCNEVTDTGAFLIEFDTKLQ